MSKRNKERTAGAVRCEFAAIDERVESLCDKSPTAFMADLYGVVRIVAAAVARSIKTSPGSEVQAFSLLARAIDGIYTRVDGDLDLVDCVLEHPKLPLGKGSEYSYQRVTDRMRRLMRGCVVADCERAKVLLPRNFSECTRLLCYGCNWDWCNRWKLLELYHDLISDMWGRSCELAGVEVWDE